MKLHLIVCLFILVGCSIPKGSLYHPDTDLSKFSDQVLIMNYHMNQTIIERHEEALAERGRTTDYIRQALGDKKERNLRILKELHRRGITPERHITAVDNNEH